MKTNEFDALIKSKFETNDFEYNQDNWERMSWRLGDKKTNRNKTIWLTIALGMAASLTVFAAVKIFRQSPVNQGTQLALENKPATTKSIQPSIANTNKNIVTATPKYTSQKVQHVSRPMLKTIQNPIILQSATTKERNVAIVDKQDTKENTPLITQEPPAGNNHNLHKFDQPFYEPNTINTRKVQLSFGGGLNHGSAGSGYMLSATASKRLNSKFYLEGDLAFVNNSTTNNITKSQKDMPAYSSENPGNQEGPKALTTTNIKHPEQTVSINSLNMYYVQLTPVLGYNVHKKMKLGMGADVQRMLQDKYKYVQDAEGNIFDIPGIDLGFVGKAEYSISERISTSVSYREGFIDKLNTGRNYLDRDYLQVQLKYTINK